MVQNLKKIFKKSSFLRHEVPFKAKNNREAVVVCAIHVVKRPSKRSVLVYNYLGILSDVIDISTFFCTVYIGQITKLHKGEKYPGAFRVTNDGIKRPFKKKILTYYK